MSDQQHPNDDGGGVPLKPANSSIPAPQAIGVENNDNTRVYVTTTAAMSNIPNNSAILRDAQGNALCNKCNTPYPLPPGCTSWRCRACNELNNASVYGDECPCCIIL